MNDLKVPSEMALFALRKGVVSQVGVYLASFFCYSGKAQNTSQIARDISSLLPIKERQVRRSINWLMDKNWLHKSNSGWYFFRSIDHVHRIEGWKYSRATKFNANDLNHLKGYLSASVLTSLIHTGIRGNGTVRKKSRTETPKHPVSHSSISQILSCSKRTAQRLVKDAEKYKYIKSQENLAKIRDLTPITLKHLRHEGYEKVKVDLLGYPNSQIVAIDRVRFKEGELFLQLPNLIQSNIQIKNRRRSKLKPPND